MLGDRARAGKVLRRGARRARRRAGQRPVAARLRLDVARRRGGARAGRRGQPHRGRNRRAIRSSAPAQCGRSRARGPRLHQHAGKQLDGARRRGARRTSDAEPVHRRRAAGRRRDLSQMERLCARAEADRRSPTPARRPRKLVTTASGVPLAPEPAASEGYALERTFYKLDGTKTDLKSHRAERARRRGAEDHRKRGALRQAAGGRPPARRPRDRQSRRCSTAARSTPSPG